MNHSADKLAGASEKTSKPAPWWGPLAHPMFRWLWIGLVISDTGTWFQDVGSGWLLTSLSVQPQVVSVLYIAGILPLVLLSFPAGVIADIIGRRQALLGSQACMIAAACLTALVTAAHLIAPWSLILLTFIYWMAAAFQEPNLEAIVPSLVPRNALPAAIGLLLAASNLGRVLGPLLAGLVIAKLGPVSAYVFNAVSFVGLIAVLLMWRPELPKEKAPAEKIWAAVRTGLLYVRGSREIRLAMICAAGIGSLAAAALALMPLQARITLHANSIGLGVLNGCFGAGSIIGAMLLTRAAGVMRTGSILRLGTALIGAGELGMAFSPRLEPFAACTLICGLGWMLTVTLLITAIQTNVEEALRARVLGIYVVAVGSGMTLGSLLWGRLAANVDLRTILSIAGGTALAAGALVRLNLHIHLTQPPANRVKGASATAGAAD